MAWKFSLQYKNSPFSLSHQCHVHNAKNLRNKTNYDVWLCILPPHETSSRRIVLISQNIDIFYFSFISIQFPIFCSSQIAFLMLLNWTFFCCNDDIFPVLFFFQTNKLFFQPKPNGKCYAFTLAESFTPFCTMHEAALIHDCTIVGWRFHYVHKTYTIQQHILL